MIEIKKESREFSDVERYLMTIAPNIEQMKNVADGEKITVAGFIVFDDIKEDGTSTEVMSIITPDKHVFAFQSDTFKRSIYDLFNLFKGRAVTIIKMSGKTKAGRDFIKCCLDVDSVE